MIKVDVRDGESLDSAIKRLKRQVQNAGIMEEARRHERYEKPSERKRREAAQAVRRKRTERPTE
jgi:small subunit ribosomal protein S21